MLSEKELRKKYDYIVYDYEVNRLTFDTFFLAAIEVRVEHNEFCEVKELFKLRKILKDERERG